MEEAERFSAAIWAGDLATVEAMIADGVDVNATNERRMPPLHLAIEQMWVEIVRRLIAAGADVNFDCGDGWTSLTHAVDIEADSTIQSGIPNAEIQTELVELLLAAGAVPTARAIDVAERYGSPALPLLRCAALGVLPGGV